MDEGHGQQRDETGSVAKVNLLETIRRNSLHDPLEQLICGHLVCTGSKGSSFLSTSTVIFPIYFTSVPSLLL